MVSVTLVSDSEVGACELDCQVAVFVEGSALQGGEVLV